MSCGIYIITEIDTGRQYIGQSQELEKRWNAHKRRGFPADRFTFEVLMHCPVDSLNFFEKAFISGYNTLRPHGFNKTVGGKSSYVEDDECRRKKSEAAKKQWATKREEMCKSMRGRTLTEAHKQKLKEAKRKKVH